MVYAKGTAAAEVATAKGPLVQRGLAARKRRLGDCDLARASTSTRQATIPPSRLRRATSLYTREAFSLCYRGEQCSSAWSCTAPNCTGAYRMLPYESAVGADSISARHIRASAGASGTPPPTFYCMGAVGANIVRPCNLTLLQTSRSDSISAPTTLPTQQPPGSRNSHAGRGKIISYPDRCNTKTTTAAPRQ